jgi:hypothetical protein
MGVAGIRGRGGARVPEVSAPQGVLDPPKLGPEVGIYPGWADMLRSKMQAIRTQA